MIREIQVEVAHRMMNMPDGKNGVMQLNMGEGKTSVIVPMLCAALAGENSICRVTVLSSIFKMNWNILKFAIGGLLNRKLYSFPCRRDMELDLGCVNSIQEVYKECMEGKGVVLTLPEYRLSFRLLAYDRILKKQFDVGLKLHETEDWLRSQARDILDESDELMSVKYQLVYTIGNQVHVDGGQVRWTVCQKIMDIIQQIAPNIFERYGSKIVEYDAPNQEKYPHHFSSFRLLASNEHETFFKDFDRRIVERFLSEVTLTELESTQLTEFLLDEQVNAGAHAVVMTFLEKDPALLNKILVLAGYIHRGVLRLALLKRWRVEYGIDYKGLRKMAVPFRAKDIAAERTEFGHPDLAIILTHLSYYYSGLSDAEMEQVFTILAGDHDSKLIYNEWIKKIPDDLVPPALASFSVNLIHDTCDKPDLFTLLRKHKMVINFWLSRCVFPRESKQFPEKLALTAWDLVYERQRLPTTGFSGTNDSTILLPLTISQQDLDCLKGTNDEMERRLLQPKNNGHRWLDMGATCKNILRKLKRDRLRILIDAGALMLDLDNEQIAQVWLEIDQEIQAVVYFSKDNDLMVKSRTSLKNPKVPDDYFEHSPYQEMLEQCGIFLDDQHTRGTDLKFPIPSKACVTIGSRMKREKLIQACMRMRKLGDENGHSVAFYLSHEANNKVMEIAGDLSTKSVLNWVNQNTIQFNEDGLVHWAIAGKNYAQRLAAEDIFHCSETRDEEKAMILAKQCVDKEVILLKEMYGHYSEPKMLVSLIEEWFKSAEMKITKLVGTDVLPKKVFSRFREIRDNVKKRCQEHILEKRLLSCSANVNEQHEKVLELEKEKETEIEEQRQVQRPPKCIPVKPFVHPNVVNMLIYSTKFQVIEGMLRLSDIFRDTSFADIVQPDHWSVEIYATNDFISVIESSSIKRPQTNSYLRPMEYLVSNQIGDKKIQLLLLSPFEVNELVPAIRAGKIKCPLHLFAMRKFEKQNMLVNVSGLQLPPAVTAFPVGETHFLIQSSSPEIAALILASGSLYFGNQDEQEAFASFLSLAVMPWTDEMRGFYEQTKIARSGFLLTECRKHQSRSGFQKDPTRLVRKILTCRHPYVSKLSHVLQLLDTKCFVDLSDIAE